MASEYDNDKIELEDDEEIEREFENDEQDEADSEESNQDEKNAYAEIMGEMAYAVASSIPPLSLAVAASEVAKAGWDLYNAKDSSPEASQAKFQLLMGIIAAIPGVGGGFRLAFKSLIRKPQFYGPVMFDVVVAILEEANRLFKRNLPLNPEKYLTQMIDVSILQGYLDEVRVKSVAELNEYAVARWLGAPEKLDGFLRGISGQLTTIINDILAPAVRIAIERCVLRRRNSAKTSNITSQTKKSSKSSTNGSKPTVTKSRGNLTARIKSQFQSINMNFVIGGVGEHIADYYCLEQLGWGKGQWDGHDKAKLGTWKQSPSSLHLGKLNDDKKLTKNSYIGNDTGIDGLWRAAPINNQGKKYAIVEAKATTGFARSTPKYVASKLGVLSKTHKGKPVIQMDHFWIGERIKNEIRALPNDIKADFSTMNNGKDYSRIYTRHIIVVSLLIEPGLSHIEALLDKTKSEADHRIHNGILTVVHKYGEPTIENIIQAKHLRLKNKGSRNKPK